MNARPGRRGHRIKRCKVLLLLGSAQTAARAVRSQQKAMPVIGCLAGTSPDDEHARQRDL